MEHRKRSGLGGDEDDEDGDRAGKARPWNPYSSSRIVRVSRASGGKDRHSKVLTAKGLRDRRVRLSVSTAIQFYDLQDRLGVDQPSKAVDWLIRAAEPAIAQLPSLPDFDHNNTSDAHGGNGSTNHQCSSTSETSKGSGSGSVLSLSRTDSRVKARERAKERAADRERSDGREEEGHAVAVNGGANLSSQSSFTELLAGGGGQMGERKPMTADYFGQLGVGGGEQLQQFSYLQEHVIPMEYGINFSLSSGLAGLSRGTLQSNSSSPSSHFPHHQHHHHHGVEGGSLSLPLPFFFGAPASAAAGDNQFSNGFGGRYGDGYGHSELKGKGKA